MEYWKNIDGFEGYQVSNLGNVRSLDRIEVQKNGRARKYRGRVLAPRVHSGGYLNVQIKGRNYYIHRLVAEAFLPKEEGKPEVNHKDGNKKNNKVSNLEWVTPSENQYHSKATGLAKVGEQHVQAKLTSEQVTFIRQFYKPRHEQFGAHALAERFGVAPSIVSRIANGKKRLHG